MAYFKPEIYQPSIFEINYQKLLKSGITTLIFDLDNTLALLSEDKCPKKTKDLINKLKKDFQVIIISNNTKKRIKPYKDELKVDAISLALKPSTLGLKKITKKYKVPKEKIVMIGDQLLTDIISGKRFHIKTILVEPLGKKDLKVTFFNRLIENIIIKNYTKKGIFERGKFYE